MCERILQTGGVFKKKPPEKTAGNQHAAIQAQSASDRVN
jgi:hypothetical protein